MAHSALFREDVNHSLGRVLRATALLRPGTTLVRELPVLTMTPLRAIEATERKALLQAVADLGASTLDLFCAAHAFVRASTQVRAAVLNTFCGIEAVRDVGSAGAKLEAVSDVDHVAQWCSQHMCVPASELRQALMCFQLNAHMAPQLSDRRCGALYAVGSRFTHACVSANCAFEHDGNLLVHRVVREIQPGDILTTNYLGPWEYGSTRMRRAALMRSKCFFCECDSCLSSADAMRAMPCPACGIGRGRDGLLPEGRDGDGPDLLRGTVIPVALEDGREEWRCASCGHALSAEAMDVPVEVGNFWPLVGGRGDSLLSWEARVESAAHNLLMLVYASKESGSHPALARLPAILGAVSRLLGRCHWVTAFLLALQLEALLALTSRMAHAVEQNVLAAVARELGVPAPSLDSLLARCTHTASALRRWQEERAPLAAAPLFEDVTELAELACRVAKARAPSYGNEEQRTFETVLTLVRADIPRVHAQLGEKSSEAVQLQESQRVLLEALENSTVRAINGTVECCSSS